MHDEDSSFAGLGSRLLSTIPKEVFDNIKVDELASVTPLKPTRWWKFKHQMKVWHKHLFGGVYVGIPKGGGIMVVVTPGKLRSLLNRLRKHG